MSLSRLSLSSGSRRNFLCWLGAGAALATGVPPAARRLGLRQQEGLLGDSSFLQDVQRGRSLKELAAARGLFYGAASSSHILQEDLDFRDRFVQECGVLTPEYELKMRYLRPTPEQFDFSVSDRLVKFAQQHDMLLRGHTLVWHEDLPDWFEETINRNNAERFLTKHIDTVVRHYAGQIHSWDVVNEAVEPGDRIDGGWRRSPWLELLGEEYVELAFRSAALADSDVLLVYNDYGMVHSGARAQAKRDAVLSLMARLKEKETPIHALGMQAHIIGDQSINTDSLREFLKDVASLNLKVIITELDVNDQDLPADPVDRDHRVAMQYAEFLSTVLEEPAVIGVVTWGLSDRYTWISSFRERSDGLESRPLLLDQDLNPKLAWNAVAYALDNAPLR